MPRDARCCLGASPIDADAPQRSGRQAMAQVLKFPTQRRRHQRVPICQPVALVHENATVVTGMATNLSIGGLQVVCDRRAADALCGERRRFRGAQGPRIDLHFKLPLSGGLVKLDIETRLTYVNDIARSQVLLGLEFVLHHHDSHVHLATFLREADSFD